LAPAHDAFFHEVIGVETMDETADLAEEVQQRASSERFVTRMVRSTLCT